MYEIKAVPIPKQLMAGQHVRFVSLDLGVKPALPLAVVHYSVDGEERRTGLRLDLDKRILLDCPAESGLEPEAQECAARLFAFLGTEEWGECVHRAHGQEFSVRHSVQTRMSAGYSA